MATPDISQRSMPHNLEVEKSILGAVLLDNQAFNTAAQIVGSDDFFSDANQLIFKAMAALSERAEAIDPVTLREELRRRDAFERAGGSAYIASLVDGLPQSVNVEQYARIVKDKSALRQLIGSANSIIQEAMAGAEETDDILDRAEHSIFQISEDKIRKGFVSTRDLAVSTMEEIEQLQQHGDHVTGIGTGYTRLDQMTAGFQRGDLIILAARPSMGKCLTADAEIVLKDGSVATIEELVRDRSGPVPTLREDLKLDWARPSAFVDDGVKPAFEVRTRLGRSVTTTLTHPFLTIDGWQPVGALEVGSKIAVPRRLEAFGAEAMRDCEVKLLAYLIGDGGLTGTTPRFTNADRQISEEFADAVGEFGGVTMRRSSTRSGETPSWRISADRRVLRAGRSRFAGRLSRTIEARGVTARAVAGRLGVSPATITHWRQAKTSPNAELASELCDVLGVDAERLCPEGFEEIRASAPNGLTRWLAELGLMGKASSEKFVPARVFKLPREQLALFLNRLFAADGWASVLATGQAQLGYATTSERLARQVQHLLLRFGVIASLRQRSIRYRDTRRPAWQLDITDSRAIRRFAEQIGIFSKEEQVTAALQAVGARRYQTNRDLIPVEVWDRLAEARGDASWRQVAIAAGIPSSNIHAGKRAPTRDRLTALAAALEDSALEDLANSDVYWDEIVSIEAVGDRQVYDLTIPETHNFVANDICVHNTALSLNIAQNVALPRPGDNREPGVVGFFSLEMSKEQVMRRLVTAEAQVDAHKLATGFLSKEEIDRLVNALDRLSNAPIYIDDTAGSTVLEMRAKTRRLKAEHGCDLVVIDYLQLVRAPGQHQNRNLEIGEISRSMKAMAKEMEIPVLALSQLSRAPESRSDHRPQLSDLRESGNLEQDADVVSFIFRPEVYDRDDPELEGKAELIISKQRNGPIGSVPLVFLKHFTLFRDRAEGMGDEDWG